MSTQKRPLLTLTLHAVAVISTYQAVTLSGDIASAGAEGALFATSDAAIGDDFSADALGTTTALAGEAIEKGEPLEVGTGGKLVVQTTGARVGWALADAATDTPVELFIDRAPAPSGA